LWQEDGPARVDSDDDAATDVFLDEWGEWNWSGALICAAVGARLGWMAPFYWLNWEISLVQKLLLE